MICPGCQTSVAAVTTTVAYVYGYDHDIDRE